MRVLRKHEGCFAEVSFDEPGDEHEIAIITNVDFDIKECDVFFFQGKRSKFGRNGHAEFAQIVRVGKSVGDFVDEAMKK
jgi:hypothetical protein